MPWSQFEWLETDNLIAVQSKNGCCVWFSIISQNVGSQVLLQSPVVCAMVPVPNTSSFGFSKRILQTLAVTVVQVTWSSICQIVVSPPGWLVSDTLSRQPEVTLRFFGQSKDMSLEDVIKSKGLALDWNQVKLNPLIFGMQIVFKNCQIVMKSPFLHPFSIRHVACLYMLAQLIELPSWLCRWQQQASNSRHQGGVFGSGWWMLMDKIPGSSWGW